MEQGTQKRCMINTRRCVDREKTVGGNNHMKNPYELAVLRRILVGRTYCEECDKREEADQIEKCKRQWCDTGEFETLDNL